MDKKKIGAAVGVVTLTFIIAVTQLFDFSIFSFNDKKDAVKKALLENALAEGLSDEVKEKKTITYKQEEKVEYIVAAPIRNDEHQQSSEEQIDVKISVQKDKEEKSEVSEETAVEENSEKIFSGYIQTEARLRKSANTECDVLDVLDVNTFVKGVVEGDWLKIEHNGYEGYVKLDLIGLAEVHITEEVDPEEEEHDNQDSANQESEDTELKDEPDNSSEPDVKPEPEVKPEQDTKPEPEVKPNSDDGSESDNENSNQNQSESESDKPKPDNSESNNSESNSGESSDNNVKPEEEEKPKPNLGNENNQNSENHENESQNPMGAGSVDEYSIDEFKYAGMISWNGKVFSFYSQNVLPGEGLNIPGRHCEGGYVRDGDGYIVLASDYYPKGTVISTPFGSDGKVYDSFGYGKPAHRFDVYIEYFGD